MKYKSYFKYFKEFPMAINVSTNVSSKILTGLYIKRFPYLLPPLTSLEAEIEAFNKKREFEKSVMSDFELKKDKTQKEFMESAQKAKDKLKLEIINVKEKLDIWLKYKKVNLKINQIEKSSIMRHGFRSKKWLPR